MIKFFRKIRQKLLTENPPAGRAGKFSKYLFYGIGEIVLVVIGILIALYINNWNQLDSKNKERIALLEALKTEMISLKQTVTDGKDDNKLQSKDLLELMEYSSSPKIISLNQDSIKLKLQRSLLFFFFDNFSLTYEEAKSSGKLSLIENDKLLIALRKCEENINGLKSVEVPVFGESYNEYNARVNILERINIMSNGFVESPKPHPKLTFSESTIDSFLKSEETYKKLYHLYYMNTLRKLWWSSIEYSLDIVIAEIDSSLKQ